MSDASRSPSNSAPVPDADVCARCAQTSDTCCALTPGQEEFCFPISTLERAAMEAAGATADNFHSQQNTPAFVDNLARLFPAEETALHGLFPLGGQHHRLALAPRGNVLACSLLGPAGCSLPRAARPLYCRLFPFWVRDGKVEYFDFLQCQAVRERSGSGQMYLSLGMSEKQARTLYAELRHAWGLPARA